MHHRLPARTLLFLGAMYAALAFGAAAAQAAPSHKVPLSKLTASQGGTFDGAPKPFRFALAATPGVLDGRPNADQLLLEAARRHQCESLHLNFIAGGNAQSAALVLKRQGRPDVAVQTETDTTGSLHAALRPGRSWQLAGSTPSVSIAMYVNGWASCRSARGLR